MYCRSSGRENAPIALNAPNGMATHPKLYPGRVKMLCELSFSIPVSVSVSSSLIFVCVYVCACASVSLGDVGIVVGADRGTLEYPANEGRLWRLKYGDGYAARVRRRRHRRLRRGDQRGPGSGGGHTKTRDVRVGCSLRLVLPHGKKTKTRKKKNISIPPGNAENSACP